MKKFFVTATLLLTGLSYTMFASADGNHDHGTAHSHSDTKEGSIGKPGDVSKVTRVIEVSMNDAMRFTPDSITVKRGETVKFVVKNTGQIKHEMVLGSAKELLQHAAMMRQHPGMHHSEPNQVSVAPGKSADFIWQFGKAGKVDFACLEPGHFEAGMKGAVAIK